MKRVGADVVVQGPIYYIADSVGACLLMYDTRCWYCQRAIYKPVDARSWTRLFCSRECLQAQVAQDRADRQRHTPYRD